MTVRSVFIQLTVINTQEALKMKKALLIVAALMMISAVAYAGPNGYMGLYADEGHSQCSFISPGGFAQVEMYIYALGNDAGLQAAEFQIIYPSNVISSTLTGNPDISVAMGSLEEGISVAFLSCHYDWTWTHHQTLYVKDTNPSIVELHYDPGLPAGQQYLTLADCTDDHIGYEATLLNNLYLNQECVIANEETSWGAIKDLYNK